MYRVDSVLISVTGHNIIVDIYKFLLPWPIPCFFCLPFTRTSTCQNPLPGWVIHIFICSGSESYLFLVVGVFHLILLSDMKVLRSTQPENPLNCRHDLFALLDHVNTITIKKLNTFYTPVSSYLSIISPSQPSLSPPMLTDLGKLWILYKVDHTVYTFGGGGELAFTQHSHLTIHLCCWVHQWFSLFYS